MVILNELDVIIPSEQCFLEYTAKHQFTNEKADLAEFMGELLCKYESQQKWLGISREIKIRDNQHNTVNDIVSPSHFSLLVEQKMILCEISANLEPFSITLINLFFK